MQVIVMPESGNGALYLLRKRASKSIYTAVGHR